MESDGEESGSFHIDSDRAYDFEVALEFLIVLPNATIGSEDSASPIVFAKIANIGTD